MMSKIYILNPTIINEGRRYVANLLIEDGIITEIGIDIPITDAVIINAEGKYLLPGIINAHVHFREPGLTYKGSILTESKAAVAGGITSYMEMPNTLPNAITNEILDKKFSIAASGSFANYSFYIGITESNLSEVLQLDNRKVCGITDDGLYFTNSKSMLVDHPQIMRELLNGSSKLVAIHSEKESIIEENLSIILKEFGEEININFHPTIRSEEACFSATSSALKIAKETEGRLHVLHLSTAKEAFLFDNTIPLDQKKITAEVCVHHLWFCDEDYKRIGARIKWNPAIKTTADRDGLLRALLEDRIDIISTDHAPHTIEEKNKKYTDAPGGAPMVQHSLVAMLEFVRQDKITLEKLVEKMCHNAATIFRIESRGFIRKGYHADLVLVEPNAPWVVSESNILYKCGWSPFEGTTFNSKVFCTIVNGQVAYIDGEITSVPNGQEIIFNY